MNTNEIKVGTKVMKDGYEGTVTRVCEWDTDLVEVRLASGTVCVASRELTISAPGGQKLPGRFEIKDGKLYGPVAYMQEQGNAKLDRILAGDDAIFNMTSHLSPSVETAICVALQTDFAGWLGMKQAESWLEKMINS